MISLLKFVPVPLRSRIPLSRRFDNAKAWRSFANKYRHPDTKMLAKLDKFPDSILVAGCQRSGGTMLTGLIGRHSELSNYCASGDRELVGARILAGEGQVPTGRYCFQTTYLNEHYTEYFNHEDFRLIWIIRRPESVVRSMLRNWSAYALEELFEGSMTQQRSNELSFPIRNATDKACYAYIAKCAQLQQINDRMGQRLMVVDYDDFVLDIERGSDQLFHFLDLRSTGTGSVHSDVNTRSLRRADDLTDAVGKLIEDRCLDSYERSRLLIRAQ